MAEPESVLERLDFQTPIPCYYLDLEAETLEDQSLEDLGVVGFDCPEGSGFLVVWTCEDGHSTEAPFCAEHSQARTGVDCWTCGGASWPGYCRVLPRDYWPGEGT